MTHHGRRRQGRPRRRLVKTCAAVIAVAAIAAGVILYNRSADPTGPLPVNLPAAIQGLTLGFYEWCPSLLRWSNGVYETTGAKPDVVMYYSGWFVPFPTKFATTVGQ